MKLTYDRDEDILTIETVVEGAIDHAEQSGQIVAHFTESGHLSVLEILHASDFLASVVKVAARGREEELPEPVA